jgi:hypothetical protein
MSAEKKDDRDTIPFVARPATTTKGHTHFPQDNSASQDGEDLSSPPVSREGDEEVTDDELPF